MNDGDDGGDLLGPLSVPRGWFVAAALVALLDVVSALVMLGYAFSEGRTMACLGGAGAMVFLIAAVPPVRFMTRVPLDRRSVVVDALLHLGVGLMPILLWLSLLARFSLR